MNIKALFLLCIFLLNTAVGLHCALRSCSDDCKDEVVELHQHPVTSVEKDKPCCQGAVNSFASLAKLVPQTVKVDIQLPVALIAFFHPQVLTNLPDVQVKIQNFVVKRRRPPTSDTRIRIQSFQI